LATKKTKGNRYKPELVSHRSPESTALLRKKISTLTFVIFLITAMSLGAVWIHDAVVQSPFLAVKRLDITGLKRVTRDDLISRADLDRPVTLFEINPDRIEKKLTAHPWVAKASVKRRLFSTLAISIVEQVPLAIVEVQNQTKLIINTLSLPFKEYDPDQDRLGTLPVISGLELSLSHDQYLFQGKLFDSVMDLVRIKGLGQIKTIHTDTQTGILIQAPDIYNQEREVENKGSKNSSVLIPVKLGFQKFEEKLIRARKISRYMADQYPSKTILAMDLYNIEKIFIKTEDALHNTLEKGA